MSGEDAAVSPRISIVVPAYNEAGAIAQTIEQPAQDGGALGGQALDHRFLGLLLIDWYRDCPWNETYPSPDSAVCPRDGGPVIAE